MFYRHSFCYQMFVDLYFIKALCANACNIFLNAVYIPCNIITNIIFIIIILIICRLPTVYVEP
jgi:hypothetical protein